MHQKRIEWQNMKRLIKSVYFEKYLTTVPRNSKSNHLFERDVKLNKILILVDHNSILLMF